MISIINHPFRNFPALVQGKYDTFDGVAKVAPVGPDYSRSLESWVIMDVTAIGAKHRYALPEAQWSALALWLKRDAEACKAIDATLNQKARKRA
jgi:hypothetical protein